MSHVCACGVCGATHRNRLLPRLRSDHSPAGDIAYCIDLAQTISFGTPYTDYTKSSLAADGVLSPLRKGEIAQLFHGFYTTSLLNTTNSAAFQLALWEIVFETGPSLDVDGAHAATRGVNYASNPDTPGSVIATADSWLAGLGAFSTDTTGLYTYRSPEHQDQIVYHRTPEPPTLIILGAGLGLIAFLTRRRVNPWTEQQLHRGRSRERPLSFCLDFSLPSLTPGRARSCRAGCSGSGSA